MFHEIVLKRVVVIPPANLFGGLLLKASILMKLLEDLKTLNCTEDHGYYIAATTVESVGEGKVRSRTGSVVFPVEFRCLVFMPHIGEALIGEVTKVLKHGCFLFCGPMEGIFLHALKMKGFEYKVAEIPELAYFVDIHGSEIKKGSTVRFRILGLKWIQEKREFHALGTINGDYLGVLPDEPLQGSFWYLPMSL